MHSTSHYIEVISSHVRYIIREHQINKAFCLKSQKLIVKHNRLVSFDHSKETTERNKLIVNAKERNIIDSFIDSIEYFDRRISTIVDVTKTIFSTLIQIRYIIR